MLSVTDGQTTHKQRWFTRFYQAMHAAPTSRTLYTRQLTDQPEIKKDDHDVV